jgi:hypothetical protein
VFHGREPCLCLGKQPAVLGLQLADAEAAQCDPVGA